MPCTGGGAGADSPADDPCRQAADIDIFIEKIVFIRNWLSLMDGLQRSCLIPGICVIVCLTGATSMQLSGVAGFFMSSPCLTPDAP